MNGEIVVTIMVKGGRVFYFLFFLFIRKKVMFY